jgi:site-specific DNA-methyltransferase (adenine-specific)
MKEMNNDKQMKDVWIIGRPKKDEKQFGKHPTQKPELLIERIILSSTQEDDIVLDMFNGSGTIGVVCVKNQRNYIGIESSKEYYDLSLKRLKNIGVKIT